MSRRARSKRPTEIPPGFNTMFPDFIHATHRWAASVDNTGQFAHVDMDAHLYAFPSCRAFNCGTYADHRFARQLLLVCIGLGICAYALFTNWVGALMFAALMGIGLGVYKHKQRLIEKIHESQWSDQQVLATELKHTRQFVIAMLTQFETHFEEHTNQRDHLVKVLRHRTELEYEIDAQTVQHLRSSVRQKLDHAETRVEHMTSQGDIYQVYQDAVRWYTQWHRLFVQAVQEADNGHSPHKTLTELRRLMASSDRELERAHRFGDNHANADTQAIAAAGK